ncbi:hypothetical protein [Mameliella sediminis]|uniref:hypothetical protein n=1 Tax=Mameliella sediminis TaxID=2836866 RepID=UPI001C4675E6|nr:hypothetical protein [Mameliella sediminis]MBV7393522.1 hypothetical protein [Mameliella sediminis]
MSGTNGSGGCARTSWTVAAVAGALAFILLMTLGGWGAIGALIVGALVFGVLGFLMSRVLCSEQSQPAPKVSAPAPRAAAPAPEPVAAPQPVSPPDPAPTAEPQASEPLVKPTASLAGEDDLASRKGDWRYEGTVAEPAPAPMAAAPAAPAAPVIKPSTPLAGEAELASRKGSWTYVPN